MIAEDLYERYTKVLFPGDLRDIPPVWLGIVGKYFEAVAPIMASKDYEVVTAKEYQGGLDLTWTARLSVMTPERHDVMDREDTLIDLRSYHTCPVCGRPAGDWKIDGGEVVTACDEHGVGTRSTRDGFVKYDAAADDLVVVWNPAGDG